MFVIPGTPGTPGTPGPPPGSTPEQQNRAITQKLIREMDSPDPPEVLGRVLTPQVTERVQAWRRVLAEELANAPPVAQGEPVDFETSEAQDKWIDIYRELLVDVETHERLRALFARIAVQPADVAVSHRPGDVRARLQINMLRQQADEEYASRFPRARTSPWPVVTDWQTVQTEEDDADVIALGRELGRL